MKSPLGKAQDLKQVAMSIYDSEEGTDCQPSCAILRDLQVHPTAETVPECDVWARLMCARHVVERIVYVHSTAVALWLRVAGTDPSVIVNLMAVKKQMTHGPWRVRDFGMLLT